MMTGSGLSSNTDFSTFIWFTVSNTFALSLSFLSRVLYEYLLKFFIIYRQYQSSSGIKMTQSVLERIEANYWLSDGKIMSSEKMLPHGLIIGKYFRFFAFVNTSSSPDGIPVRQNNRDITVWTWRWDNPIIPDTSISAFDDKSEEDCDYSREGWVFVLRMNLYASYSCRKESAEPIKCPTLEASKELAGDMYKAWMDNGKEGRFIISGPPGCGKSISARIFAHKIHGVLCPY